MLLYIHLVLLLGYHAANAMIFQVNYGYFASEASPTRVACARGWFNYNIRHIYHVTCYPQTSGTYAAARLDDGSLHIAELGSTPLAQALARGVDLRVVYIDHYKGDSQGIYVRPSEEESGYEGIETPFDLRGKKLGVPFGSTMHYQVLFLLDLFGMTGEVELLNLSPSEISRAWDEKKIDAAACWGLEREHILGGDPPGNVLVSAGVLADWGRETYNAIAVDRNFMANHPEFMEHFVSIMGRLTDSFLDNLGEDDVNNVKRWTPTNDPLTSYMPSLADALMKAGEEPMNPSIKFINDQRRAMNLYKPLSMQDQLSCDQLGNACGRPSHQHIAMQKTANFLMDQKVIHSVGRLSIMGDEGDDACLDPETLCGSDLITGDSLNPHFPMNLSSYDGLAPFFALNETGRAGAGESSAGDSDCSIQKELEATTHVQYFGDRQYLENRRYPVENPLLGQSYSDNLDCWWTISPCKNCSREVELSFSHVRIWSSDYIRVYSDPTNFDCNPESKTKILLGQITGLDPDIPNFRARGCILVHFKTDANQERSYNNFLQGDGFYASYKTVVANEERSCTGLHWGPDCSFTKHCLGTSHIDLDRNKTAYLSSGEERPYPNSLDCIWEVKTDQNYILFNASFDLEPTYDYLELYSGSFSSGSAITPYAFLSSESSEVRYYIPTDASGLATIRFVTDSLGRRTGFTGSVTRHVGSPQKICRTPGTSGIECEIPHCIAENSVERGVVSLSSDVNPNYQIGRVVSQIKENSVPVNADCVWTFRKRLDEAQGIRLRFNNPLDLEPQPVSSVGDKVVVKAGDEVAAEIYVEECAEDDVCSYSWQTGKCDDGACTVRRSIDINIDDFSGVEFNFITDRSDGGKMYRGVDFDTLFIGSCPAGPDVHCEAGSGKCVDGGCICNENIPCACPCDTAGLVSKMNAALLWVLVPIVFIFIFIFIWYRRRKILKSREQKKLIQDKEQQLEAFRNSVVGMRTATTHYMPTPMSDSDDATPADDGNQLPAKHSQEKIQWCWKETPGYISNHSQDMIVGNPTDCWIKYEPHLNAMLEAAFQSYSESNGKSTSSRTMNESIKKLRSSFSAKSMDETKYVVHWNGYNVDVRDMIQTKEATGFQRDVQRVVEVIMPAPEEAPKDKRTIDIDMSEVEVGNSLPDELSSEPQMALVKGDVVQISSQRQDGWAFGTKLHHEDEGVARELVRLSTNGTADSNIFTDTGWFPLDTTEIPSGEELSVLQSKVGGTDALQAPPNWDDIVDPTIVQLHKLKQSDREYDDVVKAFLLTLKPPKYRKKVKVIGVERIQNLAMWQSYVVKRQTICYRETGSQSGMDSPEMNRALDRFERHWLWHGTNVEVMDKIMQQGFNRSFCGKNATVYGKGVYFARDAEYSAYPTYAVPDKKNVQYMMACRVIVGEYCPGVRDALTPDVRDSSTQTLYDTTVGLLSNDTMANPSIYVTYHDAQAYPEYLIKFKASSQEP